MTPSLTVERDGLAISWLEPGAQGHRLRYSRRTGDGWSEPVTIVESKELLANWADFPRVVRHPNGTLLASWPHSGPAGGYAYDVRLALSDDEGRSWKQLGPAHRDGTPTEHGFVSMVPDGDAMRLFWLDGREMAADPPGPMALRTALVDDVVHDSEIVDARVCDCCGTSAATTSSGPVVVYRDRSDSEVRDISLVRWDGSKFSEPVRVAADEWTVPGCPVNGPVVVSDGDRLAVAWFTGAHNEPRVRVAFSSDGGRSFASALDVSDGVGEEAPLGRVDLVWTGEGGVVVSWLEGRSGAAAIAARRVHPDGRRGAVTTLASTSPARSSGFPQLERRGGELHVAWTVPSEPTRIETKTVPLADVPSLEAAKIRTALRLELGGMMPAYRATTLSRGEAKLKPNPEGPTLVNFWATWCRPCLEELPVLAKLKALRPNLTIVGVSLDEARLDDEVARFVERHDVLYQVWRDPENLAAAAFGVNALPASFLFDRDGRLVWRHDGAIEEGDKALAAALDGL